MSGPFQPSPLLDSTLYQLCDLGPFSEHLSQRRMIEMSTVVTFFTCNIRLSNRITTSHGQIATGHLKCGLDNYRKTCLFYLNKFNFKWPYIFLYIMGSQSLFPHLAKDEVVYIKHSDGKDRFQCMLPPCLTLGSKFTEENTPYYCTQRL